MRHDPLKRFIEENKEAFDELLPAPDVLPAVRTALAQRNGNEQGNGPKKNKRVLVLRLAVAATVLLAMTVAWMYFLPFGQDKVSKLQDPLAGYQSETPVISQDGPATLEKQARHDILTADGADVTADPPVSMQVADYSGPDSVMDLLSDDLSASSRLEGIFSLADRPVSDQELIDILEDMLATDPSINVRMAAFDLLIRDSHDTEKAVKIVENLSKQKNPILQLALMNQAAGMVHTTLPLDTFQSCLDGLMHDPATLPIIRQEAEIFLFAYQVN